MANAYASITGTSVLQLKDIPPRPAEYDGRIALFAAGRNELPSEDALRASLGSYGEVLELARGSGTEAHARFATHAQAEAAVAAMQTGTIAADFVYNTTHYDKEGGTPYSGWCTFEQGVSMMVAAHVEEAVNRSTSQGTALPDRLTHMQRPKLIDISDGQTRPREVTERPKAVLEATTAAIEKAKFVGKGDKLMVTQLFAELEWTVKTVMEQARLQDTASGLTLPPAMVRRAKREVRVDPPPTSSSTSADDDERPVPVVVGDGLVGGVHI